MTIRIDYLADHPDFIPTLAQWHYEQFGYLCPGSSISQFAAGLQAHLGKREIPTTFVALVGRTLVGSASLIAQDMDTRAELSPWLASVYVAQEYRKRGIGTALVQRVAQEAQALGVATIYLYTPDKESFYARRRWSLLERTQYRGYEVSVMMLRVDDPQEKPALAIGPAQKS